MKRKKIIGKRLAKRDIFNTQEESALLQSAKIASSKAVRSSIAMGITIKIIRNNHIIAINPDKTQKIIRTIKKHKANTDSLKKGMVLERI